MTREVKRRSPIRTTDATNTLENILCFWCGVYPCSFFINILLFNYIILKYWTQRMRPLFIIHQKTPSLFSVSSLPLSTAGPGHPLAFCTLWRESPPHTSTWRGRSTTRVLAWLLWSSSGASRPRLSSAGRTAPRRWAWVLQPRYLFSWWLGLWNCGCQLAP